MTPRERIIVAMRNEKPDHVPAAPDMSMMVPLRLLGKPSWECVVYSDPPIWKAQMDACAYYGVDAFFGIWPPESEPAIAVVYRDDEKMITRDFSETERGREWSPYATVVPADGPTAFVQAHSIGLPNEHESYKIVRPNYSKWGREYFEDARDYVGENGVAAPVVCLPALPIFEDSMYRYYDDRDAVLAEMRYAGDCMMRRAETLLSWNPDVLLIGNSGLMISNPPPIFREIGLEWLRKVTRLAKEHGVITHMHCCGPEKALVEMAANETDLDSIEPLEIPPMGDCILKEIKDNFGKRIALKGNLHTTELMLKGTPEQVRDACKQAIDDAAEGGGFILSTGDQTPRDAPDENIRIMQEIAESYGKY